MASRPYIVVKTGGTLLEQDSFFAVLTEDLKGLLERGFQPVVVHGGGKVADDYLTRLGIPVKKWKGRRITSEETLKVISMVYRGNVQTRLGTRLNASGVKAIGMSGSDGWVRAERRAPVWDEDSQAHVDLGWVGDVREIDPAPIHMLVEKGYLPLVDCMGSDGEGHLLNINADTLATRLAIALKAEAIVFLTDVPGILRDASDPATVIPKLCLADLRNGKVRKAAKGGMLPKVDAVQQALESGIRRVYVLDGLRPFVMRGSGGDEPAGTVITREPESPVRPASADDPVRLLEELIAIPSVSGNEKAIADFIEEILQSAGLHPVRLKNNVAAVAGTDGPVLLLNAHLDTVPPSGSWSHPPFEPTRAEGEVFGLGAGDCKGPLTAVLIAFLRSAKNVENGTVIFTATAEEETSGKDLPQLVQPLGKLDGAIICEPTDLQPCTAQKGLLRLEIEVTGRAAHASRPWSGENAIAKAKEILAILEGLSFGDPHPLLGPVTVTPTRIRGGDVVNRVPDFCQISLDVRYPPGVSAGEIHDLLLSSIPAKVTMISDRIKPVEAPAHSRLMNAVHRVFAEGEARGMFGASNWCLVPEVPGVVLGPGNPKYSHAADERIAIADLTRGVDVYSALIEAFVHG